MYIPLSWQAEQKLSYALAHCNPRSEANIRFVQMSCCINIYIFLVTERDSSDKSGFFHT